MLTNLQAAPPTYARSAMALAMQRLNHAVPRILSTSASKQPSVAPRQVQVEGQVVVLSQLQIPTFLSARLL
jgi:hypothetical protein